jgi:hypothetical protein
VKSFEIMSLENPLQLQDYTDYTDYLLCFLGLIPGYTICHWVVKRGEREKIHMYID